MTPLAYGVVPRSVPVAESHATFVRGVPGIPRVCLTDMHERYVRRAWHLAATVSSLEGNTTMSASP